MEERKEQIRGAFLPCLSSTRPSFGGLRQVRTPQASSVLARSSRCTFRRRGEPVDNLFSARHPWMHFFSLSLISRVLLLAFFDNFAHNHHSPCRAVPCRLRARTCDCCLRRIWERAHPSFAISPSLRFAPPGRPLGNAEACLPLFSSFARALVASATSPPTLFR
jgi:hypothetical protein